MTNATQKAINTQLHRDVKNGSKYNSLIPFSDCSSVKLAKGDTKVAIDNMAYWSRKYKHHTKDLSKLFKGKKLDVLCTEIHKFLFENFQYKIDGAKQRLLSPACAWISRFEGLDCKSYSINGSTILLNLGIHHYFRRIKMSANEGYSHVYLIVPKNQKQPKKLSDGYYIIDGTLRVNKEPFFYQSDDVFMEAELEIYGLAGVAVEENTNATQNLGQSEMMSQMDPLSESLLQGAAQFVDQIVAGLMDEIFGCASVKYQQTVIQYKLQNKLLPDIQNRLSDLDDAIKWSNTPRIQSLFNDVFKELDLGVMHLRNETAFLAPNECEYETLTIALKYVEKIKDVFDTFYENFKTSFTRYKIDEYSKDGTTNERTMYFVVENAESPVSAPYRFISIREEESDYGVDLVLPFQKNPEEWLLENKAFLKLHYNDGRESDYEKEVRSIINEVISLRDKVYLGGEGLYLLEPSLQREMYTVWLKYDDNYTDYIFDEAQDYKLANEIALKAFETRLEKEIEADIEAKKLKTLKRVLGYGGLAFASFLIIKK